jgi:hypothetical protein
MNGRSQFSACGVVGLLVVALLAAPAAHAVPSFARQTGMACEACHTVFPELNHFGRMFKANAYTIDNLKQVRGITATKQEILDLSGLPPISLMIQVSQTSISTALPDVGGAPGLSQKTTVAFPQLTYGNDTGTIGIDNTDLRYANSLTLKDDRSLVYGVSANNNPTVQDLWNSTPAFGFPYASSNATVSPLAGTQIDGALAQDVAGISAYVMWNEALYAEIGTYRSAKQGARNPITGAAGPLDGATSNVIVGGAPYYRLAYEQLWGRNALSVGIYGANFKLVPGGTPGEPSALSGPYNEFKDFAQDFQYQFIGEQHLVTVAGTHIKENMTLNASVASGSNASDDLTTTRAWVEYYYRRKYGATVGYFSTTGSTDPGMYPNANSAPPIVGVVTSANGSPDTKGWIAELNYMPWLNTRLTLQATQYTRFNGGDTNYDGFGRNASNNNSLYFLVWFNY